MIITPRLQLIRQTVEEVDSQVKLFNNWEIAKWLGGPPFPYTDNDWYNILKYTDDEDYHYSIYLEDKIIGNVDIFEKKGTTLGYMLDPEYWNQGYISEAIAAVLNLWDKNVNVPITASIFESNVNSIAVMKKFNFKLEFTDPDYVHPVTNEPHIMTHWKRFSYKTI